MIKVLVADIDMDSHELVDDILQINFRDIKIDRVLNGSSFLNKIRETEPPYNLILFNPEIQNGVGDNLLQEIRTSKPHLLDRMILLDVDECANHDIEFKSMSSIKKPFSLDHFAEIIKKTCAS